MNCLSLFLGESQSSSKKDLLFGTEELLWLEFVFSGVSASQKAQMQRHYVLLAGVYLVQRLIQVVEHVVIAHHNQNIPRANAQRLGSKIIARFHIELIQFRVGCGPLLRNLFRNFENNKECDRKSDARFRSNFLG